MEEHSIFSSPKYAWWPWMVCRSEEGQGALARCRAFQRRSVLAASWLPTQTKTLRTIQYFYSASSVLLQYRLVEWRPGKSFTKWPTAHYDPDEVQLSSTIWQMPDWLAKCLPHSEPWTQINFYFWLPHLNYVTRAPLLLLMSWVALSFKLCESVSEYRIGDTRPYLHLQKTDKGQFLVIKSDLL